MGFGLNWLCLEEDSGLVWLLMMVQVWFCLQLTIPVWFGLGCDFGWFLSSAKLWFGLASNDGFSSVLSGLVWHALFV
jgi:hypothetical protein